MVSLPPKLSRCALPPMMDCSTQVQALNPKSCSLETRRYLLLLSTDSSKYFSMRCLVWRDKVATVVGYHTMVSTVSRKVHSRLYSPVAVMMKTGVWVCATVPSGSASMRTGKNPLFL